MCFQVILITLKAGRRVQFPLSGRGKPFTGGVGAKEFAQHLWGTIFMDTLLQIYLPQYESIGTGNCKPRQK